MASLRLGSFLLVLVHAILLLICRVHCSDDEDNFLQGINSHRTSLKLPPLVKNDKAECLAEKIAEQIEDQPCTSTNGANTVPGSEPQLAKYPDLLSKCKIDVNHTTEGVILPVCVPKLVPTLVLTNYTHTQYAKYINESKYTGAGVGSEDDWMVLVLSTNTTRGSFAGAEGLISKVGLGYCFLSLMLGLLLCLV